MEDGYVKLWRKSRDSRVFQNADLWKVWCWCLMKASHKERWVTIQTGKGDSEVKVLPGQFIFGRKAAAKELRMKPGSVYDRIKKLKKVQNIDIQPNTHYSLITIVNWDTYQSVQEQTQHPTPQAPNRQPTPNQHPTNTDKTVENVETVKEVIDGSFQEPLSSNPKTPAQKQPTNGTFVLEVISYLNARTGKKYRASTNKTRQLIKARQAEGFTLEDFKKAIDNKVLVWAGTKWEKFLRPETLFSPKMDGYVNEDVKAQVSESDQQRRSRIAGELFMMEDF